jgi:catechol 2,3-dioxygenase-like lactoylglutathione lyase family enzyme
MKTYIEKTIIKGLFGNFRGRYPDLGVRACPYGARSHPQIRPPFTRNPREPIKGYLISDASKIQFLPCLKFNEEKSLLEQERNLEIKTTNIILYCKNWNETVAFYKSGLKLPVATSNDWFMEFRLNPTARLSVADESRTSIKSNHGNGITVGLQVENVENMRAQLVAAGLRPTEVKEVWGAKAIYIHDPEGNRIEFWSGQAQS